MACTCNKGGATVEAYSARRAKVAIGSSNIRFLGRCEGGFWRVQMMARVRSRSLDSPMACRGSEVMNDRMIVVMLCEWTGHVGFGMPFYFVS